MLHKERFIQQINFFGTLFMRETKADLVEAYWKIHKLKDQGPWDKAVDQIIHQEERFPTVGILQDYYIMNCPSKPDPTREDLRKAATTEYAKKHLRLIFALMDEVIDIQHPDVQTALEEHKAQAAKKEGDLVFTHYDPVRRRSMKRGIPPYSIETIDGVRDILRLGSLKDWKTQAKTQRQRDRGIYSKGNEDAS